MSALQTAEREVQQGVIFYYRDILHHRKNMLSYWQTEQTRPVLARKGKDMTAIIRSYNVNSEGRDAQLLPKKLCGGFVRPSSGKQERIDCVNGPRWNQHP